jgi:FlaA1/EpsC-like NDP-sugar epimerase
MISKATSLAELQWAVSLRLKNERVLVTGADGFIGSHLVERLQQECCNVKAFVYYNAFNSWGWLDSFPRKT